VIFETNLIASTLVAWIGSSCRLRNEWVAK